MDDQHPTGLSDEALGREIESALAVDPSPEFLARLRLRCAAAPASWLLAWRIPAGGALVLGAAVLLVVFAGRTREMADAVHEPAPAASTEARSAVASGPAAPHVDSGLVSEPAARRPSYQIPASSRAATQVAVLDLPDVVISETEKRGLRLLGAALRRKEDAEILSQDATLRAMSATPWIEVAPIEVEPQPQVVGLGGEGE